MSTNPETYVLRIDIEQWAFDKTKEEFESAINLELHICMKDMREKILADYDKRKADKMES